MYFNIKTKKTLFLSQQNALCSFPIIIEINCYVQTTLTVMVFCVCFRFDSAASHSQVLCTDFCLHLPVSWHVVDSLLSVVLHC
mgnify:FL=1